MAIGGEAQPVGVSTEARVEGRRLESCGRLWRVGSDGVEGGEKAAVSMEEHQTPTLCDSQQQLDHHALQHSVSSTKAAAMALARVRMAL